MIECSLCLTWVHLKCAKISGKRIPDIWYCSPCRQTAGSVNGRPSKGGRSVKMKRHVSSRVKKSFAKAGPVLPKSPNPVLWCWMQDITFICCSQRDVARCHLQTNHSLLSHLTCKVWKAATRLSHFGIAISTNKRTDPAHLWTFPTGFRLWSDEGHFRAVPYLLKEKAFEIFRAKDYIYCTYTCTWVIDLRS